MCIKALSIARFNDSYNNQNGRREGKISYNDNSTWMDDYIA
jgi:hypothetical protein